MNLLKTLRNTDVGLPTAEPFIAQRERFAARAVLMMNGKIALMYAANDNYYKLPGGGIEDGEDERLALTRELLEETGCTAEVIEEIGEIIEERTENGFRQRSVCYLAKQVGDIVEPTLTEREKAAGFEVHWANDINQAIQLVDDGAPENGGSKFMKARDGSFLRAAKPLIEAL
jgi:8-oxo-dGTP diphosphatase